MHAGKVVATNIRILFKDLASKIRQTRKLVALRHINWRVVSKIILTVDILDDVGSAEEMFETSRELTILVHVGFDQGQDCFLHITKCNSVQLLAFGLTWTM